MTSVDARELGCWSFYRINALRVIEPLKSGSSVVAFVEAEVTAEMDAVSQALSVTGLPAAQSWSPGTSLARWPDADGRAGAARVPLSRVRRSWLPDLA